MVILVTVDVTGFYPNIVRDLGLQSLRKGLNERGICKILTKKIISMQEFVLENNYFMFDEISGKSYWK